MGGINHLSTFDADLRNVSFALISFMGFPAILSTLQPFQMCIYNRKQSKLTFSNDSQLMGKRFMTNLHASLESTSKSRMSKIVTRCQNWGVNHLYYIQDQFELKSLGEILVRWGASIIFQLLMLISEMYFASISFHGVSCNIRHITAISNVHSQQKIKLINIFK